VLQIKPSLGWCIEQLAVCSLWSSTNHLDPLAP
jgi:hypothetical protein